MVETEISKASLGMGQSPEYQFLFGELVKLGMPILQHYHSDLYHDAEWLRTLNRARTFFWSCGESGTSFDLQLSNTLRENVWRIDITNTGSSEHPYWKATIRKVR